MLEWGKHVQTSPNSVPSKSSRPVNYVFLLGLIYAGIEQQDSVSEMLNSYRRVQDITMGL